MEPFKKIEKHFCDNILCPHYKLEMTDHYHSGDEGVYSGIYGVLKTHKHEVKIPTEIIKKKIPFFNQPITYKIKNYYFCDTCYHIIRLLTL